MSQEKLGEAIGLTFQQVQKYERGSNRISAGTLFRLSQVLDVPVSFFFDCYEVPAGGGGANAVSGENGDSMITRREARMLRLWRAAPGAVADELLALLGALSPHMREARDGGEEEAIPALVTPVRQHARPLPDIADGRKSGRRRNSAVWDPSDIYRAAKESARQE